MQRNFSSGDTRGWRKIIYYAKNFYNAKGFFDVRRPSNKNYIYEKKDYFKVMPPELFKCLLGIP